MKPLDKLKVTKLSWINYTKSGGGLAPKGFTVSLKKWRDVENEISATKTCTTQNEKRCEILVEEVELKSQSEQWCSCSWKCFSPLTLQCKSLRCCHECKTCSVVGNKKSNNRNAAMIFLEIDFNLTFQK